MFGRTAACKVYQIFARHYESVGPDLKLEMMKWKVLKELDFQLTALQENKKKYEPDVLVTNKKDCYFVKWLEEFVLYLMPTVGVRGVSFAYISRTNE